MLRIYLISLFSSGAFSIVYKARDTKNDELVAIKVVRKNELERVRQYHCGEGSWINLSIAREHSTSSSKSPKEDTRHRGKKKP